MSIQHLRFAVAVAVGLLPTLTQAQDQSHQMAGAQSSRPELTQCLRVQPAIENVITAAMARAQAARLSNSPAGLRAAVDDLEAALRDVRAQSAPCVMAAASADPQPGHAMPRAQPPGGAQSPTSTADPHAGHTMPSAVPASNASRPNASATPTKPAASDPHAGHTI